MAVADKVIAAAKSSVARRKMMLLSHGDGTVAGA